MEGVEPHQVAQIVLQYLRYSNWWRGLSLTRWLSSRVDSQQDNPVVTTSFAWEIIFKPYGLSINSKKRFQIQNNLQRKTIAVYDITSIERKSTDNCCEVRTEKM